MLRQQLKAIKEELGELDDAGGDLDEFGEKITKAKYPAYAQYQKTTSRIIPFLPGPPVVNKKTN